MFSRTLPFGRIRGIDVRLSPSLPLFALVVLWVFTSRFAPGHGYGVAFGMGAAGMVLFFASILVHELGHALEARHRDLEVVGITLSMFGGVTEMHAERQTARDELAVAAIGPYLSLLCAAVFGLVATFAPDHLPAPAGTTVAEVAGLLGWINVALALFNLIPGAPLDGGRVLRAALWGILRDRQRAIVAAARFGQLLWLGLIGVSVWAYVARDQLRLAAGLGAIVGLFLLDAARREIVNARLDALYSSNTVGDLLGALPDPVDAARPIADVAEELVSSRGGQAAERPHARVVVVVGDGEPMGVLDLAELATRDERSPNGTAAEHAQPLDGLPRLATSEDLHALVDRFQGEADLVVIEHEGQAIGAITEREAAQAIARLRQRRATSPTPRRPEQQPVVGS